MAAEIVQKHLQIDRFYPCSYVSGISQKMSDTDKDHFMYFAFGSNLLKERLQLANPSATFFTTGRLKVSTWVVIVVAIVEINMNIFICDGIFSGVISSVAFAVCKLAKRVVVS